MKNSDAEAHAKFYKIFGKSIDEFLGEAGVEVKSHHKHFHANNAFCGSAGAEEFKHFEMMVSKLTDEEVLEIAELGGLHPVTKENIEDVKQWLDEVGREDFYKVYNRRKNK